MSWELPLFASPFFFLGIFLASMVAFYVLFMVVWPLGKVGWQRTDYCWALAVLVGLVGSSIKIRQEIAKAYINGHAESAMGASYRHLRAAVLTLSAEGVCRPPAGDGPEADELRREHEAVCRFGRETIDRLPRQSATEGDLEPLAQRPAVTSPVLLDDYRAIDQALAEYKEARNRLAELESEQGYSLFDLFVLLLSPILVAVGAALRVVKITGEVEIEKAAQRRQEETRSRVTEEEPVTSG
ncbi:hypothetical protein [Paludisphaera rhizosphaerae]|uniref:hypothetical protein n=1 Tax=Paludisphaera rhizosphaerae TaxID=2711216 RepID=UPI0013EC2CF1|nr:hypothetical protein [Paludisphaera rhizosphaerae]